MSKKKEGGAAADEVAVRPIPNPPGGGSWKFDHAKHEWVPNGLVPETAEQAQE